MIRTQPISLLKLFLLYSKVAFFHKVLVHLSYPCTGKPILFFLNLNFDIESFLIRTWRFSEGSKKAPFQFLSLQVLILHDLNPF